jgi:molecular chaperone Hsp33
MFEPKALHAFCRCSPDRIATVLKSFPAHERAEMVEADGLIRVTCEYCSRTYVIEPAKVG